MKSNEIGRIITKDPFWLSFSVERLENRLDFFKNQFKLDKNMLKKLMTIYPKVSDSQYLIECIYNNYFINLRSIVDVEYHDYIYK